MSNPTPRDYHTTDVIVSTSPHANVTTTAHYKTKDTVHTATADAKGLAIIAYNISDATPGHRVVVGVTVLLHGLGATCSTSFDPVPDHRTS